MNLSLPLGFLLLIASITYAIFTSIDNYFTFLDLHALIIVIGGTFSVGIYIFSFTHLVNLVRVVIGEFLGSGQKKLLEAINEVNSVVDDYYNNSDAKSLSSRTNNLFLREALLLLDEDMLDSDDIDEILDKRIDVQHEKYVKDGISFKALGKFPPAFGLIGTTIGMVGVLQGLGEEGAFQKIGPSMSVALTATFWGLVLANAVLIPVGEIIANASGYDLRTRRAIREAIVLLKKGKHPLFIAEQVTSYLTPAERNKIKKHE